MDKPEAGLAKQETVQVSSHDTGLATLAEHDAAPDKPTGAVDEVTEDKSSKVTTKENIKTTESVNEESATTAPTNEESLTTERTNEDAVKTTEPTDEDNVIDGSAESTHSWYKCECPPDVNNGFSYYWYNNATKESSYQEPYEPYWIWNVTTLSADPAGLQQSAMRPTWPRYFFHPETEEWTEKYNPAKHGNFDHTAPYAKYHDIKRDLERGILPAQPASQEAQFAAAANFNRATGSFQTADQSAEHHNDANKSRRQLNAFFDVDAAANSHDGRSLKAERRARKPNRAQIEEYKEKKAEKKRKKLLDFYRS